MRMYAKYKCSWEIAREMTASSPSSLHFGHYIAGSTEETIGKFSTILANVRLLSRTALMRWKQMLNVMLEKLAEMTMSKNYV